MTTAVPARDRLLSAATRLFYGSGLHAVGVDRLVTEAGVTRATFYRHFPSKDDLVVAYLNRVDADLRSAVAAATSGANPTTALDSLVALIGQTVCAPGFRGCHFINAAAEYPDSAHVVRRSVDQHRSWFRATVAELAVAAGHRDPDHAAAVLVLVHDGALAGAQLDDPAEVRATLERLVRDLFA